MTRLLRTRRPLLAMLAAIVLASTAHSAAAYPGYHASPEAATTAVMLKGDAHPGWFARSGSFALLGGSVLAGTMVAATLLRRRRSSRPGPSNPSTPRG
jgi:hypothetical protein